MSPTSSSARRTCRTTSTHPRPPTRPRCSRRSGRPPRAAAPAGVIDAPGTYYINLSSMLASRDNLRQSESDLFVLTKAIPAMSYDGDATPDFDGSRIEFVGQSLGSITGIPFLALEPNV